MWATGETPGPHLGVTWETPGPHYVVTGETPVPLWGQARLRVPLCGDRQDSGSSLRGDRQDSGYSLGGGRYPTYLAKTRN
ncbi:hypothetical protein TNCT_96321 [Trichonephila clavata]|uniref:Uncharacterized protein n=1 Tax=Trichonephila clavata TaxID=2740835 RepID=A0A8X6F5Y3_TRICU|nr:hypothetical protein TNCT_96321 [Trichonephila clavata]